MKKTDIIFAIICGLAVAWVVNDFIKTFGWVFFILLPILFAILVDLVGRIFKNVKVIGQGIRHVLTGAFADIVDIKIFELLFWFFPAQLAVKAISFLIAAAIKYLGNKYWAFWETGNDGFFTRVKKPYMFDSKEIIQFLIITLVGLGLNVVSFSFFVKINPRLSLGLWREISVIFALLITAIWNFCGYKFIVFKK